MTALGSPLFWAIVLGFVAYQLNPRVLVDALDHVVFSEDVRRVRDAGALARPVELDVVAWRGPEPGLVPAFRHILDVDEIWNGSEGEWTACGQPWVEPDPGLPLPGCPECGELWATVYGDGS